MAKSQLHYGHLADSLWSYRKIIMVKFAVHYGPRQNHDGLNKQSLWLHDASSENVKSLWLHDASSENEKSMMVSKL